MALPKSPNSPGKTEVAWKTLKVHPVMKGMLIACCVIPGISVVLMTMGAWDIKGDDWDGALRMLAVLCSIIGPLLVLILDRQ